MADSAITGLPDAGTLNGSEPLAVVVDPDGSATTSQTTTQDVADLAGVSPGTPNDGAPLNLAAVVRALGLAVIAAGNRGMGVRRRTDETGFEYYQIAQGNFRPRQESIDLLVDGTGGNIDFTRVGSGSSSDLQGLIRNGTVTSAMLAALVRADLARIPTDNPGNNKFWGTDGTGAEAWRDAPAGTGSGGSDGDAAGPPAVATPGAARPRVDATVKTASLEIDAVAQSDFASASNGAVSLDKGLYLCSADFNAYSGSSGTGLFTANYRFDLALECTGTNIVAAGITNPYSRPIGDAGALDQYGARHRALIVYVPADDTSVSFRWRMAGSAANGPYIFSPRLVIAPLGGGSGASAAAAVLDLAGALTALGLPAAAAGNRGMSIRRTNDEKGFEFYSPAAGGGASLTVVNPGMTQDYTDNSIPERRVWSAANLSELDAAIGAISGSAGSMALAWAHLGGGVITPLLYQHDGQGWLQISTGQTITAARWLAAQQAGDNFYASLYANPDAGDGIGYGSLHQTTNVLPVQGGVVIDRRAPHEWDIARPLEFGELIATGDQLLIELSAVMDPDVVDPVIRWDGYANQVLDRGDTELLAGRHYYVLTATRESADGTRVFGIATRSGNVDQNVRTTLHRAILFKGSTPGAVDAARIAIDLGAAEFEAGYIERAQGHDLPDSLVVEWGAGTVPPVLILSPLEFERPIARGMTVGLEISATGGGGGLRPTLTVDLRAPDGTVISERATLNADGETEYLLLDVTTAAPVATARLNLEGIGGSDNGGFDITIRDVLGFTGTSRRAQLTALLIDRMNNLQEVRDMGITQAEAVELINQLVPPAQRVPLPAGHGGQIVAANAAGEALVFETFDQAAIGSNVRLALAGAVSRIDAMPKADAWSVDVAQDAATDSPADAGSVATIDDLDGIHAITVHYRAHNFSADAEQRLHFAVLSGNTVIEQKSVTVPANSTLSGWFIDHFDFDDQPLEVRCWRNNAPAATCTGTVVAVPT